MKISRKDVNGMNRKYYQGEILFNALFFICTLLTVITRIIPPHKSGDFVIGIFGFIMLLYSGNEIRKTWKKIKELRE